MRTFLPDMVPLQIMSAVALLCAVIFPFIGIVLDQMEWLYLSGVYGCFSLLLDIRIKLNTMEKKIEKIGQQAPRETTQGEPIVH